MEGRNSPDASSSLENRDKRSEVLRRLMKYAKNVEGFQGKTAGEVFDSKNEQSRRELLKDLSAEQYCQLIAGINGVLRGRDQKDWDMDGVGVTAAGQEVIGAHIFPNHNDKKEIIIKAWEAAQEMNASGRDLQEIGMLLGSMLVETHPFNDGNGRTSRLVYLMVGEGFSEEKMRAILGEDGRDEFDMALIKVYINELFDSKYGKANVELNVNHINGILADDKMAFGKLQFPEEVDQEVRDNIIQAGRNDEKILTAAILHFLQIHNELAADTLTKMYGERKVLLVQQLLSTLTNEQINELERTYWNLKKRYTEDMIDIFENPDKLEYRIEKDGVEMRMIDYFKERLAAGVMLIE